MNIKYIFPIAISLLVLNPMTVAAQNANQSKESSPPSAASVCKEKMGFEQLDNLSTEQRSLFKKCLRENAPAQEFGEEPEEEARQKRMKNTKPVPKSETERNEQMMGEHQH